MTKNLQYFQDKTTQEVLSQIKAENNNSFITVNEEITSTDKLIAIKDIHVSTNLPTTVASEVLRGFVAGYDSHVVSALKKNGYQIVGTTNMDEFAMGGSNLNTPFGEVSNVFNEDNIAGGSSGGSAYAVAKGLVPVATGTDTGGSVRQPAALNGIYGYKPSYGLISRYGTVAFASSFDTVGVLANDLDDVIAVSSDLITPDHHDTTSFIPEGFTLEKFKDEDLSKYKVAIISEFEEIECDQETTAKYEAAKQQIRDLGIEINEVSIDTIPYTLELYVSLAYGESSSNLSRFDGIRFGQVDPENNTPFENARNLFGVEVEKRLVIGTAILSSENANKYFKQAQKIRTKMNEQFKKLFAEYDLVISPITPSTQYPKDLDVNSYAFYKGDVFTIPANLIGAPSISIPLKGVGKENPVGMQIMAEKYNDHKVFALANALKVRD